MKMLLTHASDPYCPLADTRANPPIVDIENVGDLLPFIREGSHGGVIINFISDSTRAMYDDLPEYVQLELQIYDS